MLRVNYRFRLPDSIREDPCLGSQNFAKRRSEKTTYWYTETGGEIYFGNVDSVLYSGAKSQFNQHVINVTDAQKNAKTHELTAGELMDFFLDWIEKHRRQRTYSTRKTHCNRFGKFRVNDMARAFTNWTSCDAGFS